jgi:two-component system OmpR family sensor kinase
MSALRRLAVYRRASALPLRWRLTLVCVAVLGIILAVYGAALYKDVEAALVDTTAEGLQISSRSAVIQHLRSSAFRPAAAGATPVATPTVAATPVVGPSVTGGGTLAERSLADLARVLTTRNTAARTTDVEGVTIGDGPALAGMTDISAPLLDPTIYREVASSKEERHWRLETAGGPVVVELIPLVSIGPEEQVLGVLQLTTSLQVGDALLAQLRNQLLLGTMIAMLATIILTLPLIRGILAPMRRMADTSRAIAAGDLSQRVDVPASGDALADLAVAFNEMVGKLDEAFATQRRFIADASHELRTPLTALGNGVEMLQMGVDRRDPEAREKLLRLMAGEIGRMGRLADDLLTLTALDRDPAHALQRRPVDLVTLAAQVVDETRLLAPDRVVELDVPPGIAVIVRGDADKLRQALLNLCANARVHTPPGGSITVGVRRAGDGAQLTVSDTGTGIPPEMLGRVWDRFFRVEQSRERLAGAGSVGLGLAIVRAIVEAHGGSVAIVSALGEGTTITLTLPAELAPDKDRPAVAPADDQRLRIGGGSPASGGRSAG